MPLWLSVPIAIVVGMTLIRVGIGVLLMIRQPLPPPPPPGELRKVKISYRCSLCATEVRMTVAPEEDPDPPRHCGDDMDLVAPIED
ncbi:hypothetical protein [Candidatus Poriferisocius sp.]|uniref:hypothetical protein n=1 Tax=Candidatus Poriferisocius sp. TaxID=3101276 RepID=UPI003B58C544